MKDCMQGEMRLQGFGDEAFAFDKNQFRLAAFADAARVLEAFVGGTRDEH